MHTTWAPRGQTPIIRSSGSWKKLTLSGIIIVDASGKKPRLFLRSIAGNMNKKQTLRLLKELRRHMNGRKLLLIWDGLPAHRAMIVQLWIKENASWLRIARFPGYAPELNPIEYCWAAMKKKHLGNLADLSAIGVALHGARRKMDDERLLRGFLHASGLYV